jgi:TRAP-type C4-dicarboxylate transport system permease small subunit
MIDALLERLSRILGVGSSVAVMAITLAIVADVSGRYLFAAPIDGASAFAVTSMIVVVYFGLMAAQRNYGNFRVDMLLRVLPGGVQEVLEILWRLVGVVVAVLLSWLSTHEAIVSTEMGEASFGTIAFPIWPARILLAIGMWALSAQILLELVQRTRDFARGRRA